MKPLIALAAGLMTVHAVTAATVTWSGGGASQNWSLGGAGGNWTGSAAPGATDDVKFYDPGADPMQGNVNNIVEVTRTIKSLQYGNTNNFFTTQISPGVTLTNLGSLTAGTETDSATNQVVYATITGPGGRLVVSTSTNLVVRQASATTGPHLATLDLSGLDTFSANVGRVLVGMGDNASFKRAQGTLTLAATNTLSLSGADVQLMVGDNAGNNNGNSSVSYLYLGANNALNVNSIRVGGAKQRGTITFGATWTAPSLVLRGTNGTGRVATIAIGDNAASSSNPTTGIMDLSSGVVDAMADTLFVGRGQPSSSNTGNSTGTLTLGAGVFDVNTLEVGYQNITGPTGTTTGTVNVNSNPTLGTNATLVVNTSLRLGRYLGSGPIPVGTLNINGGTVRANVITNGGGTTTVSMTGGTLIVTNPAGFVGTLAAPIGTFNIADSVLTLGVSASLTNVVATTLTTASSTNNTINITTLPVITSYPAQYPLISYSSLNWFDFLLGTLPAASPVYQGYLSNNFANSTIDVVITGGPITSRALVWNGSPTGDWDTTTTNWLVSGSPTAYIQNDAVLFDDTASGTTTVNLTTALAPFTLTIANPTRDYTFTGTGGLVGPVGLNKQGAGTLTIGNSGSNGFAGVVTIGGGKLQISGSDNRLPTNAAVTLADDPTAVLDLNNLSQMIGSLAGGGTSGGDVTLGSGTLTLDGGSATHNGVISGSGAVVKNGSGTQVFSGANLYGGGTRVTAGTLAVANASGSGTGPGGVTVETNSTFALGAGGPGGSVSVSTITNNGTVSFNRSDDFTLANVIVGNGAVTKNNANTVLIPISNTYTGQTTVAAGALRVSTPNALGDATGQTYVQNDPTARLELLDGITLAEPLQLAQKGAAAGNPPCILNLSETNTLAGRINLTSGGSFWTFEAAGGELIVSGAVSNITTTATTRTIWLRGAATGLWNSTIADGGFAGAITGLRKDDVGTWTLAGNNTYTGPTVVSNGTLLVNGTIAASPNSVTVNGGTLGGTGTIRAAVTVNPNGTLAPGSSTGTLTITTNLILNGITVMEVSHSGADEVAGLTNVTFGGTLQVVLNGTLTGGEAFKLFEARTYSGDFAVYDLPALSSPLYWDTNALPTSGVLRVGGVPTISSITVASGNVVISGSGGPLDGIYYVLTSTNVAAPVATWVPVATNAFDASGQFSFTNAASPGKPQLFYLLQLP